jgi:hypothetical protein
LFTDLDAFIRSECEAGKDTSGCPSGVSKGSPGAAPAGRGGRDR